MKTLKFEHFGSSPVEAINIYNNVWRIVIATKLPNFINSDYRTRILFDIDLENTEANVTILKHAISYKLSRG